MATLDAQTREAVQVALGWGYLPYPHYELLPLGFPITDAAVAQVGALLEELADIDAKLVAAREDSMATQVGNLTISYGQHVRHLKNEGSRLLREISNIVGLKINYNRYVVGSNNAVVSYW